MVLARVVRGGGGGGGGELARVVMRCPVKLNSPYLMFDQFSDGEQLAAHLTGSFIF